jgi:hypothetical protein
MILGGYTMPWAPDKFGMPRAVKDNAVQKIMGGAGYISWGPILPGVVVDLEWEWMSEAQFEALYVLYVADAAVVWALAGGAPATDYNVQILTFEGKLFEVAAYDASWRKDVKMELLIRSVI